MQLVVPSAVRNAVSAATTIFTTNSITLCFFSIVFNLNDNLNFNFFNLTQIPRISRIWKKKTLKTSLCAAGSTSLILICRFKFCSSELDSPCPTSQNSLRLAALSEKQWKPYGNLTGNTPLIFQVFRRGGCCPVRVVECLGGIVWELAHKQWQTDITPTTIVATIHPGFRGFCLLRPFRNQLIRVNPCYSWSF